MLKRRTKTNRWRWLYGAAIAINLVGSLCFFAPQQHASAEPGEPGPYGTRLNFGYFRGLQQNYGPEVIPGGVPANDIDTLINMITSRANNIGGGWSIQDIRGAQFIVQTMRGGFKNYPSPAEVQDWADRVRSLVANGGSINFDAPISFNINSYYQPANQDDAFYDINHGAYIWQPWAIDPDGQLTGNSIGFYNSSGQLLYAIRRACGNPLNHFPNNEGGIPDAIPYNLVPLINVSISGNSPSSAEPGDPITFDYRVNSTTGSDSANTTCSTNNVNHSGYFTTPASPEGGGTPIGNGCPRVFPGNSSTQIASETVIAPANTTVCRTLFVNPATPSGNTVGTEVCVPVSNKPYVKVFGGDVSVGGGLESAPSTCTNNGNGSLLSWNEQRTPGTPGAGTQFAAFALAQITDFASSQVNNGAATPATSLSFGNTATDYWNNNFGGNFGSAPCIKDYYGQKPASTQPLSSLAHGAGVYSASGSQVFTGATLNPGDRWTIYIDGNVYINGNIIYGGNWNIANVPMLQVVVRGNIYIDGNVTQLDGVYSAQTTTSGASGNIYTCATIAGPWPTSDTNYYNACHKKLNVNGAFMANSLYLLRTFGTINQSAVGETSGSSNAAEIFNYGPAAWMTQPPQSVGRADDYDAITSLPPVL